MQSFTALSGCCASGTGICCILHSFTAIYLRLKSKRKKPHAADMSNTTLSKRSFPQRQPTRSLVPALPIPKPLTLTPGTHDREHQISHPTRECCFLVVFVFWLNLGMCQYNHHHHISLPVVVVVVVAVVVVVVVVHMVMVVVSRGATRTPRLRNDQVSRSGRAPKRGDR